MALPRPIVLALLGIAVVLSVFLVTRNGSNQAVTTSPSAGAKPTVAAPPARPAHKPTSAKAHASVSAKAHHAPAKRVVAPRPTVKPAAPARPAAGPAGTGARVLAAAQALAKNDAVVFFFSKPGAADDTMARGAVHKLRGMSRVSVFDAGLDEVAAYRPMLSGLGISQIPSTVIVRPGKKAVLLQGFVDAGTLRQNVADALR